MIDFRDANKNIKHTYDIVIEKEVEQYRQEMQNIQHPFQSSKSSEGSAISSVVCVDPRGQTDDISNDLLDKELSIQMIFDTNDVPISPAGCFTTNTGDTMPKEICPLQGRRESTEDSLMPKEICPMNGLKISSGRIIFPEEILIRSSRLQMPMNCNCWMRIFPKGKSEFPRLKTKCQRRSALQQGWRTERLISNDKWEYHPTEGKFCNFCQRRFAQQS